MCVNNLTWSRITRTDLLCLFIRKREEGERGGSECVRVCVCERESVCMYVREIERETGGGWK